MEQKSYGYIRVSTKEQNEDRQFIAMPEANVSQSIRFDKIWGQINMEQEKRTGHPSIDKPWLKY